MNLLTRKELNFEKISKNSLQLKYKFINLLGYYFKNTKNWQMESIALFLDIQNHDLIWDF